jgi:16S rRNA (guanine527-N7)-methyltransferase
VVDVGTGAGAPGLPLAILRPDLEVTLVEPLQKRVALLRMTQGKLRQLGVAPGLEVRRGKGEDLVGREHYDVAVSRATLAPPRWLELGGRLAKEVVVLVAQHEPPERQGWVVVDDHRYEWPRTGAQRRMIVYRSAD